MNGKYKSPFGMLYFKIDKNRLTSLEIVDTKSVIDDAEFIKQVKKELDRYFKHKIKHFKLPFIVNVGTKFQREVWQALLTIEYGETKTYQDIAIQIGRPMAFRAVGQACKKNPLAIIIPCHRVIGKDGSMRGYSGLKYKSLKQKLLNHEQLLYNKTRFNQALFSNVLSNYSLGNHFKRAL